MFQRQVERQEQRIRSRVERGARLPNGDAHRAGIGEAILSIERERGIDQVRHGLRCVGGDRSQGGRGLRHRLQELLVRRSLGTHEATGNEPKERGSERPQVGAAVDAIAVTERLLGRHEGGSAHRRACPRALGTARVLVAGDAEVQKLDPTLPGQKDVLGLDVPMNDAFGVRGFEDLENLIGDRQNVARTEREGHALPARLKRLSLEQLHH